MSMICNFHARAHAPQSFPDVLCPQLNVAIQVICGALFPEGFDIGPKAPHSYKTLREWMDSGKRLMVSNDGLGGSIYGSPGINAMFRAWHDYHHYHGGHDFSPAGEKATAELQCRDLARLYGLDGSHEMRRALMADVVGQSLYYKQWGKFVGDQMGFVRAYLDNPNLAILREW